MTVIFQIIIKCTVMLALCLNRFSNVVSFSEAEHVDKEGLS